MPWTLDNAEERAAAAPRRFFIPPRDLRHALKPGDGVKLIFRLEREDGEVGVERMWVDVDRAQPGGPYEGTLDNVPHLEGVIALGDRVSFGPEHVCGYAYTTEELGYDATADCYVSKSLADGDEPPRWLFFDEEGDWQALTGEESDEEMDEPLNWLLGYLTDRFPSTEGPLREDAPEGTWWRREGDGYVRSDGP